MLVFNNLNKFYTGSDYTKTTPLNSQYLNSIIKQIEKNFIGLDERISHIESVIINDSISAKTANIEKIEVNEIIIKDTKIETAEVDDAKVKKLEMDNAVIEDAEMNSIKAKSANFENLVTKLGLFQNLKVSNLSLFELKISDFYILNNSKIVFYENADGIEFKVGTDGIKGIKFSGNERFNTYGFLNFRNSIRSVLSLSLESDNRNDYIEIKSPSKINLVGDVHLTKLIFDEEGATLGIEGKPLEKVKAKQFYGSYFSYNADIAEVYEADKNYEPGTILQFGDATECSLYKGTKPVIGVVSDSYGYLLNNEANYKYKAAIALKGRVYCKLSKKGNRGDYIIPDINNPGYGIPVKERPKEYVGILLDPEKDIIKV